VNTHLLSQVFWGHNTKFAVGLVAMVPLEFREEADKAA